MIKQNQRLLNRTNLLLDTLLAFISMLLAYWLRFDVLRGLDHYSFSYYAYLGLFSMAVHALAYSALGLYQTGRRQRAATSLARILVAEVICALVNLSALFLVSLQDMSRLTIFFAMLINMTLSCAKFLAIRAVLRAARRKGFNQRHVVIIGMGDTARAYYERILQRPELGYRLTGYFAPEEAWAEHPHLGGYEDIEERLRDESPDEAVIALPPEDYVHIRDVIRACDKCGILARIIPCYDDHASAKMVVETVEGINIVDIRDIPLNRIGNAMVKRSMDIVFSIAMLAVSSPILLVAAIGVKLSSPGPILFRQRRIGKNKKEFDMLKFRSMRLNDDKTAWTKHADARKTRFGSILRKLSIDELPQFLNVLRGDMSIVGPRPEIPFFVDQFRDEVPLYMIRHFVKPGVTGWAQVNGYRGDTSIRRRIEYDIEYIEGWSLGLDLRIMLRTATKMVNDEEIA